MTASTDQFQVIIDSLPIIAWRARTDGAMRSPGEVGGVGTPGERDDHGGELSQLLQQEQLFFFGRELWLFGRVDAHEGIHWRLEYNPPLAGFCLWRGGLLAEGGASPSSTME